MSRIQETTNNVWSGRILLNDIIFFKNKGLEYCKPAINPKIRPKNSEIKPMMMKKIE